MGSKKGENEKEDKRYLFFASTHLKEELRDGSPQKVTPRWDLRGTGMGMRRTNNLRKIFLRRRPS